ncbi:helix-turn-helix domain-containing protein [Pseudactinotalea sp. HY160]|nr:MULTISPECIES: helix-turn-helix domain-containing protein [unclassified Pseudactinotalea]MPV48885.1 helix-turn-helix domain-containing protein [Pseudactinotalea sp. HY160]QGH70939.1 helix-turn-helix domain-containing protein [Pseudactinotalea sp. HY158]
MEPRFLTLADVTEILQVSMATVRALVRSGELRGIQVGGKGTWRIERVELEAYIERCYAESDERTRPA